MSAFQNIDRIIQETVPGRQVTLAHVIPKPVDDLYSKLGIMDVYGAIGIFTITPRESAIIAADVASKAADVKIGFVDRFSGALMIYGDVAAVEAAIRDVMHVLCEVMGYTPTEITRS